jgi:hypothetical protein
MHLFGAAQRKTGRARYRRANRKELSPGIVKRRSHEASQRPPNLCGAGSPVSSRGVASYREALEVQLMTDGFIRHESRFQVDETMDNLVAAVAERGLAVILRLDHCRKL